MARKPKAPSPEKPPKRKMTQEQQSARFIETARQLGVDETGVKFERAFDKVSVRPPMASKVDPNSENPLV